MTERSEAFLDRLDRKVDQLLDRTKNVENDHQEIIKLRERMHAVEGKHAVFSNLLEEFKKSNEMIDKMDQRLEIVERDQVTASAVKRALEDHEAAVDKKTERREKRIFAVLGLLASVGALNLLLNIFQAPPPSP